MTSPSNGTSIVPKFGALKTIHGRRPATTEHSIRRNAATSSSERVSLSNPASSSEPTSLPASSGKLSASDSGATEQEVFLLVQKPPKAKEQRPASRHT